MADVFLSYSSKDRPVAAAVERALAAAGYDVFWDQETPTGRDWNTWIGEKLAISRVVIVIWSKASVASRNVVHEATIAIEAGKMIPAVAEDLKSTDFPMGFYTVQGADLRGFRGGDHPGMAKLLAAVKDKLGDGTAADSVSVSRAQAAQLEQLERLRKVNKRVAIPVLGFFAVLALFVGGTYLYGYLNPQSETAISLGISEPAVSAPEGVVVTPATGANALVGQWHWTGIACGQGPEITRDGDLLVVSMVGAPTYKHAIESAVGDSVNTVVVEPEDARGQAYNLTRIGETLNVKNMGESRLDTWEKCS